MWRNITVSYGHENCARGLSPCDIGIFHRSWSKTADGQVMMFVMCEKMDYTVLATAYILRSTQLQSSEAHYFSLPRALSITLTRSTSCFPSSVVIPGEKDPEIIFLEQPVFGIPHLYIIPFSVTQRKESDPQGD